MPFADIDAPKTQFTSKKKEYLKLGQGQTVIRILENQAHKFYTHYINGSTIQCLGEDCPVCRNNHIIYAENPDTYKEVKGYAPKVQRFLVNVLDRTVGKVCPECKATIKKAGVAFPSSCSSCNTVVAHIKEAPLNRVSVLAKGVTLFEQFDAFETSVLDENETPLPLTSFDIVLNVSGAGRTTKIVAIPVTNHKDVIEISKDDLYDLSDAVIKLTSEEIIDLQRGISLTDIFAARKAVAETKHSSELVGEQPANKELVEEELAEVEDELKKVMEG